MKDNVERHGSCGEEFTGMHMESICIETNQIYYRVEVLCRSLAGVPIPIITLSANRSLENARPFKKRKYILVTARVHPGETNSSFKMQGLIHFLTRKGERVAQSLRENFVFKIVPVLNPDGVVLGNFRTSLAGVDLNRRWQQPDRIVHPTIFHLKELISRITQQNGKEILVYCDMHGHSKKKNSFIYGCNTAANGGFCSWTKVLGL